MRTVMDTATRAELISRINSLGERSAAQWGKMNVYQMLKHCRLWEEMALGKTHYKRVLMGRLFGRIALRSVLRDDAPLGRNSPTIPAMKITGNGDVAAEKAKWIAQITAYEHMPEQDMMHPFFGKVTKEQTGYMAYKHADHHLRQFNC